MFLQYTFARAFRSRYIAMLPTNKKSSSDVNYNNKYSKGMFNKKRKIMNKSGVVWFEFWGPFLERPDN